MAQMASPKQCAWVLRTHRARAEQIIGSSLSHHLLDAEYLQSEGVTADMVLRFQKAVLEEYWVDRT